MKKFVLLTLVSLTAMSTKAADSLPIVGVNFNNSRGINLRGDAKITDSREGASGDMGDRALRVSPDTEMSNYAVVTADPENMSPGLEEITVTAWYKVSGLPQHDATLFSAYGTMLIWDAKIEQWVWRVDARPLDGGVSTNWFNSGKDLDLAPTDEWVFIAMTWSRSSGDGTFYLGSFHDKAVQLNVMKRSQEVQPLKIKLDADQAIGGSPKHPDRNFDGMIDNVRFYASALTMEDVETIRKSDTENKQPRIDW